MFAVFKLPKQFFLHSLPVTGAPLPKHSMKTLSFIISTLGKCCTQSFDSDKAAEVQKVNQYPQWMSKNTVVICLIGYQC